MARKTQATNSQKWKKVKVGSRIAVYWPKHRNYFACKVLRKNSESSPKRSHFFVEYEGDDSRHWHDLEIEKFRFCEDVETYLDDEAEEDAAGNLVDVEDGQGSDGTPHMMSENDEEDENQNEKDDTESDDASVSATNSTANEDRKGTAALTNHSAKENDGNQDQQGRGESHGEDENAEADFEKVKRKSTTDTSSKRRLEEEVDDDEEEDSDYEDQDQDEEAKNDENDDEESTTFTEKNIDGKGSPNKWHEEVVESTNNSAKNDDNIDRKTDDKKNRDQDKTCHLKNQEEDFDAAPERKTTADTSEKKRSEGTTENSKDFEMEDKVDKDQKKGAKDDETGNEKEDEDSKPRLVNESKQNSQETKSPPQKDNIPQAYTKDPAEHREKDQGRGAIDDRIGSKQSNEKAKGKNVANASAKEKRKEPPDTSTKDEDRGQGAKDDNDESKDGASTHQPKKKVKGNTAKSPSRKKKRKGSLVVTHADEDDKEMDDEDVKDEVRKENEHVIPQEKDKAKDVIPQVKDKVQGDTSTSDTSMSTKRPSPKKRRRGDVESNKGSSTEEEGSGEEGCEPIKKEGDDTEAIQDGSKDSTNNPKNGASDLSDKEKENSEPNRSSFLLSRKSTVEDIEDACEQKKVSKEDALLSVMMIHYMAGTTAMTFDKLAEDLGYHSKSKALVQAWNTIRKQNLVEEEGNGRSKRKLFQLTSAGIDRVAPEDYDQNDQPTATQELHERIKEGALNEHGVTIFEELARVRKEGGSLSRKELGAACGVASTTKIFRLAFQQLKDDGYIISDSKKTSKFTLAEKCFLD